MVNMTTAVWTPDTCTCTVEYEWDKDTDESSRVHTFKKVHMTCKHHEALQGKQLYDQLSKENGSRSTAVRVVQETNPELTVEQIFWRFSADRKTLFLAPQGLGSAQKQQLQSRITTENIPVSVVIE